VAIESLRRITVWGLQERRKQARDVFSKLRRNRSVER
jgi:hypothetical protein